MFPSGSCIEGLLVPNIEDFRDNWIMKAVTSSMD
jgi:hypothetical protein